MILTRLGDRLRDYSYEMKKERQGVEDLLTEDVVSAVCGVMFFAVHYCDRMGWSFGGIVREEDSARYGSEGVF